MSDGGHRSSLRGRFAIRRRGSASDVRMYGLELRQLVTFAEMIGLDSIPLDSLRTIVGRMLEGEEGTA